MSQYALYGHSTIMLPLLVHPVKSTYTIREWWTRVCACSVTPLLYRIDNQMDITYNFVISEGILLHIIADNLRARLRLLVCVCSLINSNAPWTESVKLWKGCRMAICICSVSGRDRQTFHIWMLISCEGPSANQLIAFNATALATDII